MYQRKALFISENKLKLDNGEQMISRVANHYLDWLAAAGLPESARQNESCTSGNRVLFKEQELNSSVTSCNKARRREGIY
jgi:hypothetical protein